MVAIIRITLNNSNNKIYNNMKLEQSNSFLTNPVIKENGSKILILLKVGASEYGQMAPGMTDTGSSVIPMVTVA